MEELTNAQKEVLNKVLCNVINAMTYDDFFNAYMDNGDIVLTLTEIELQDLKTVYGKI